MNRGYAARRRAAKDGNARYPPMRRDSEGYEASQAVADENWASDCAKRSPDVVDVVAHAKAMQLSMFSAWMMMAQPKCIRRVPVVSEIWSEASPEVGADPNSMDKDKCRRRNQVRTRPPLNSSQGTGSNDFLAARGDEEVLERARLGQSELASVTLAR